MTSPSEGMEDAPLARMHADLKPGNPGRAARTGLCFLLSLAACAHAELKIASPFTGHAVLQRGIKVPVWGSAAPNVQITVEFRDQKKSVMSDAAGRWRVDLDPLDVGPSAPMIVSGDGEVRLEDILAGEVWFASGQSNMALPVFRCLNPEQEIASADQPDIRFFCATNQTSADPVDTNTGAWASVTPATVRNLSGAAWFFARDIHEKLHIPIGIIQSAWGGTLIEAWMSKEALGSEKLTPVRDRYARFLADFSQKQTAYETALQAWQARKDSAAKTASLFVEPKPPAPIGPGDRNWISGLYNAMVHPFIPYAIRGVIWYQGEGNSVYHALYADELTSMIEDWRGRWGEGNFPFYLVQLPNWIQGGKNPPLLWAYTREAQYAALKLPSTGIAVTIDIGEANELHPKNKQEVGRRLGLLALAKTYGLPLPCDSPMVRSCVIQGNQAVLEFDHVENLTCKQGVDTGFELAGADHVFHPAQGVIEKNKVIVTADTVSAPVAVRYAFANNPETILFNEQGLPAAPFRSDSW